MPWRLSSWALRTGLHVLIIVLFFAPDFSRAQIFLARLLSGAAQPGDGYPGLLIGFVALGLFWVFHYVHARLAQKRSADSFHPLLRAGFYTVLAYTVLFGAVDSAEQFIYFQF